MKPSDNRLTEYWGNMAALIHRIIRSAIFIISFLVTFESIGHSGVVIFDQVTTLKTAIYLKVLTKGRIFSTGGKLVDIYADDQKLKRILTGGDGYGYLKYTPLRPGLVRLEARSDADRDTGVLLVCNASDKVILIDVESGFKESVLSGQVRADSRKAVEELSKSYKLIYLNTMLGSGLSKSLLQKEGFPEAAALKWQGAATLKTLKKRGVNLYAIIGSAEVIAVAAKYIEHRYTFEETKEGQTAEDWEEIVEFIQKESNISKEEQEAWRRAKQRYDARQRGP